MGGASEVNGWEGEWKLMWEGVAGREGGKERQMVEKRSVNWCGREWGRKWSNRMENRSTSLQVESWKGKYQQSLRVQTPPGQVPRVSNVQLHFDKQRDAPPSTDSPITKLEWEAEASREDPYLHLSLTRPHPFSTLIYHPPGATQDFTATQNTPSGPDSCFVLLGVAAQHKYDAAKYQPKECSLVKLNTHKDQRSFKNQQRRDSGTFRRQSLHQAS